MATRAAKSAKEQIEAAAEAPPEPVQPNGVFVLRAFNDEGALSVDVQVIGDVKITEAPTILALGKRLVDSKLEL